MNWNMVKIAGSAAGSLVTTLLATGAWSTVGQFANQRAKATGNDTIGNVQRGVEHQARKMNIMKD